MILDLEFNDLKVVLYAFRRSENFEIIAKFLGLMFDLVSNTFWKPTVNEIIIVWIIV